MEKPGSSREVTSKKSRQRSILRKVSSLLQILCKTFSEVGLQDLRNVSTVVTHVMIKIFV